jgi:hypothetical protein
MGTVVTESDSFGNRLALVRMLFVCFLEHAHMILSHQIWPGATGLERKDVKTDRQESVERWLAHSKKFIENRGSQCTLPCKAWRRRIRSTHGRIGACIFVRG